MSGILARWMLVGAGSSSEIPFDAYNGSFAFAIESYLAGDARGRQTAERKCPRETIRFIGADLFSNKLNLILLSPWNDRIDQGDREGGIDGLSILVFRSHAVFDGGSFVSRAIRNSGLAGDAPARPGSRLGNFTQQAGVACAIVFVWDAPDVGKSEVEMVRLGFGMGSGDGLVPVDSRTGAKFLVELRDELLSASCLASGKTNCPVFDEIFLSFF